MARATTGHSGRPAFYAARTDSRLGDWWTVLHPPYTAWHLSYVVVGAVIAPHPTLVPLFASLGAFFLAVGLAAHCLDELKGRPLNTSLSRAALVGTAAVALLGAAGLGGYGISQIGPVLVPFMVVGVGLVVVYNLELAGQWLHNGVVFALGWGGFPVLTAYVAEARTVRLAAVLVALFATLLSGAQRALSNRARRIRRSTALVEGRVVACDGTEEKIDAAYLLAPTEAALRLIAWATIALAAGLAVDRMS